MANRSRCYLGIGGWWDLRLRPTHKHFSRNTNNANTLGGQRTKHQQLGQGRDSHLEPQLSPCLLKVAAGFVATPKTQCKPLLNNPPIWHHPLDPTPLVL